MSVWLFLGARLAMVTCALVVLLASGIAIAVAGALMIVLVIGEIVALVRGRLR